MNHAVQIMKFVCSGILFGLLFNALYCYSNYYFLLNNRYMPPIILSIAVGVLFLFFFFLCFPKYYRYLFRVKKIKKLMFTALSFLPLVVFFSYFTFLSFVFWNIFHDNQEIVKTGKYIARTASRDVYNDDIRKNTKNFFEYVLEKQNVPPSQYEFEMILPNNKKTYGEEFTIHIYSKADTKDLEYATFLVPFPKKFHWAFYYCFTEGEFMEEGITEEKRNEITDKLSKKIRYTTPFGDYVDNI